MCKHTRTMQPEFFALMRDALDEAEKGFVQGEVPVGAVLARPDGKVIARAHNQPITLKDPTAHAEILAIKKGCLLYENYRLPDSLLVVTLEPCVMCMGAAVHARVAKLVFGAVDPKRGAAGSLYNLAEDTRLNHRIEVISGVMETECRTLLQDFFQLRR